MLIPSVASADGLGISLKPGYAPISGYLQTPAGGEPGSSDIKRPTFDELGVDDAFYTDIDLYYKKGNYTPYFGLRLMTIDSAGVLEKDLTTRDWTFFQGESFDHETIFNIYRLGAKYDFGYLSPKVELAVMDFNYEFKTQAAAVKRSYAKSAFRLGAEKTFRIDALEVMLEASGSVPIPNTPDIYTVTAGLKYWLADYVNVGLELQYFYLDYEDDQELPNHLRLEMQPAVSVFLQFRF